MKGPPLAQLICGKSRTLLAGYDKVFTELKWAEDVVDQAPMLLVSDILAFNIELWTHHGAAYKRRVVNYLDQSRA